MALALSWTALHKHRRHECLDKVQCIYACFHEMWCYWSQPATSQQSTLKIKKCIFWSLGLIVSWLLLAVTNSITFHVFISTASGEFVAIRGCTIMHLFIRIKVLTKYIKVYILYFLMLAGRLWLVNTNCSGRRLQEGHSIKEPVFQVRINWTGICLRQNQPPKLSLVFLPILPNADEF